MGSGALAAAAQHGTFELDKLATWQAGQPVPFAFLADTFESVAETPKRILMTNLLVSCNPHLGSPFSAPMLAWQPPVESSCETIKHLVMISV